MMALLMRSSLFIWVPGLGEWVLWAACPGPQLHPYRGGGEAPNRIAGKEGWIPLLQHTNACRAAMGTVLDSAPLPGSASSQLGAERLESGRPEHDPGCARTSGGLGRKLVGSGIPRSEGGHDHPVLTCRE